MNRTRKALGTDERPPLERLEGWAMDVKPEKRGGTKGKQQRRPSRTMRGLMRRNGGGYSWSPGPEARYLF